jgi:hypothetical protein
MSDTEVRVELMRRASHEGETESIERALSFGAGERPLLNLYRGLDRKRRIDSGQWKTATVRDEALFKAVKDLSEVDANNALRGGANVNARDKYGSTPLHAAMPGLSTAGFPGEEALIPIVKLLVERALMSMLARQITTAGLP